MFSIFESKFRKKIGNNSAFSPAIQELTFLYENGISITVDGHQTRVFFCFCLIIADNLGANGILEFVESFTGNFFCRMCKLHRVEMNTLFTPVPDNKLRTVENYDEDLIVGDVSLTGLNGPCVWNRVPSFHCVTNAHCDVMHDIFLGMLRYGLCNILYYFIHVRGYFDIELLKDRIAGFNYGPSDVGNKPPTLHFTLAALENCSLNLSAAEFLFLGRHLSLMIGDLIEEGNEVWHFYLILREILEIICAPSFDVGVEAYLGTLVQEHNELYLRYFGSLKPKMHLMQHYCNLLRQNGPLVLLCALMCERNHRRGKLYAGVCNSRVNLALSSAIKFQLMLSERLMRKDNFTNRLKTSKVYEVRIDTLPDGLNVAQTLHLNLTDFVSTVKKAEIFGTLYTCNMIIVLGVDDLMPRFGKIIKLLLVNDTIIFLLNVLETVNYLEHVSAYQIAGSEDWMCMSQSRLQYNIPLWERDFCGKSVVALKHSL